MTTLTEAIELINQAQANGEKKEKILDDVESTIQKANNQTQELVKRVRLLERGDTERAILHDLYEISSTLLDAISDIHFS